MRNGLVVISILLLGSVSLMAQRLDRPVWVTTELQIGMEASAAFASSDIQNAFIRPLVFEETLDPTVIEDQLSRLGQRSGGSRFGGDYTTQFSFHLPLANAPLGVVAHLSDRYHISGEVSDDAVRLAFRGNAPFAGDTLAAGSSRLFSTRYQKIGMGLTYEQDPLTTVTLLLSYIHGSALLDADIERADLYTSAFGDTLRADVRGSYRQTAPGRGIAGNKGSGAALDFWVHRQVPARQGMWQLDVGMIDLGWVQWYADGVGLTADTVIEWTGLTVSNETALNGFGGIDLQDSLIGDVSTYDAPRISNVYLPGWAQASVGYQADHGFGGSVGMAVRWETVAQPFGWVQANYRFGPHVFAGAEWGYGGMASSQVSLIGALKFDKLGAQLRVGNVEALILPQSFGGASASCSLTYHLGT